MESNGHATGLDHGQRLFCGHPLLAGIVNIRRFEPIENRGYEPTAEWRIKFN